MKKLKNKHLKSLKIVGLILCLVLATALCVCFVFAIKNTPNREDIILYNGRYYSCYSRVFDGVPSEFVKVGELTTVENEMPTEEFQMKICSGFEVSGTVFANENNPDVLYINYNAKYIGRGEYHGTALFVTDRVMWDHYIYHQGQLYKKRRYSYYSGMYHYGFPDKCVEGEVLRYTGDDFLMPTAEGETNWGNCEQYDEEIRIIYDPEDSGKIYTYANNKKIRDNMGNVIDTIDAYYIWRLVRE